jgi:hypothetical protein
MSKKRAIKLLPARRGDPRASVAAFALQIVLLFIIVPSFIVPVAMDYLRDDRGIAVMPERITFITAVPERTGPSRERPRAGGDGRAPSSEPAVPNVQPMPSAPTSVPTGIAEPSATAPRPSGGVGPLVGGGGPTAGVRPSFNDPRLWVSPSGEVEAPMIPLTRADSLELLLRAATIAFMDSANRAAPAPGRAPGDWTYTSRSGKKYGIDPKFIRLGDFSIPTAVLALLPMNNVQGNPTAMDRARRLSSMRNEILEQAERRARDDDFYAAVRALRERKEKERREAQAAQQKSTSPPATSR